MSQVAGKPNGKPTPALIGRRGPPLRTVGQVSTALGKVIRAMMGGTLDTQDGARIANALGILRQSLETTQLAAIEDRLDALSRKAP